MALALPAWAQAKMECRPGKAAAQNKKGLYDSALDWVRACPEGQGRAEKGMAFYGLYQPDSALAFLKPEFDGGNHSDSILLPLAEAFLWKKDFRNAALIMEGVKDKGSAAYLKVEARKHEILGDLELAVARYDQAIALEKLPYGTMERKAIVLSWMKRFDESIAVFDAILAEKVVSKPLKIRCLIRKAEVMSWKGKDHFDPALALLGQALRLDKGNVDARLIEGRILEWKGEYQPAKAVYKEILALAPGNEQAKLKLEKLAWVE